MEAQKHYYYPGFREQFRFPPEKRDIAEELPLMFEIEQEERVTVRERRSRESGFLGVSLLHRLHRLYKFDVIKDLVFDVMHLVPLNLVKRRFEYFLSNSLLDTERVQPALEKIPWTQGTMYIQILVLYCCSNNIPLIYHSFKFKSVYFSLFERKN